jgi:DNA topoisomerase-1
MVVARERGRIRFVPASYWSVEAVLSAEGATFAASLAAIDGARLASGKDFNDQGKLKSDEVTVLDEAGARELAAALEASDFRVNSLIEKPYRRSPSPPFMTSTLQQEAGRKLRFSAQRTMRAAQRLYEGGFITYMRTDSTTLSDSALSAARKQIGEMYGSDYVPSKPRIYTRNVKNAQEAHDAIRPAGDHFKLPEADKNAVGPD